MGADASQLKGNSQAKNNKNIQSLSNLTPAYVLKLKQRFESMSDDYNLTKEGLKEFFKCNDREVDTIFRMFDSDNNGSIDSYEFMAFLTLMTHGTLRERAETLFQLYDFDQSNSISKDELSVLMQNALTALKCMEGKPGPSLEEIEQKTSEFFKAADTNNDQQISKREFLRYIQTDRQILEVLMSYGIANRSELGTDFGAGNGSVPECDSDLEEEANPKALRNSERKNALKHGNELGEFEEEEADAGDQALQNFSGVIKNQVPDYYRPSKSDSLAPDASLDLEYAFGIRCHDVRNNLRYTADGKLVYNCAGLGIVMDKKQNSQQFFRTHQDDIHCMAISPDGVLCATGEIGPNPLLCVWNNQTMEQVFLTDKPCVKGIKNAAFSPNGQYLAVSDMSDDHNVYIYDVKAQLKPGKPWTPIAGGKGVRNVIFSLGWNDTSDQVIATCNKAVVFFSFANGKLTQKKGTGFGSTPCDGVLCQALCGQTVFTGHQNGEIIAWSGSTISKRTKAHTQKVDAIYSNGKTVISGGADGQVCIWNVSGTQLTQAKTFDIKQQHLMSMNPQVKSVCESKNGESILVSTRGGEIFEFNVQSGKACVYMRGHFDQELWGLATHPTLSQIYTFGQDGMLAVWDLPTKRQLKHCKLDSGGDAIAFSNSGKFLALGFQNGTMMCLDDNFQALTKRRDRPGKAIQCLKFSPDDTILAAGGHDQLILTYDVLRNFKPLKKLRGCDTTIWQIDFSLDSQSIVSDALLFWNVQTGKHNPHGASQLKNETWHTWTTRRGWCVNGIYPPCATKDDINGVDRSPDGKVVATGDDFGLVKLFKFPCPVEKSQFQKFTGHSSHVTDVKFTRNKTGQKYLVSTGGNDKAIFMWKYQLGAEQETADEEVEDLSGCDPIRQEAPQKVAEKVKKESYDDFEEEEADTGDQALAVSQFKGQVQHSLPDKYKNPGRDLGKEPEHNLELKWAHGFRSFDTRNNLKYSADGNVVFTTAGLGVVQNTSQQHQAFFNMHKEDIVALAIHPNRNIIATGQMAGKELNEQTVVKGNAKSLGQDPSKAGKRARQQGQRGKVTSQGKLVNIHIWDASTRELITTIFGFQRRAVRQLDFSHDGTKLLTIGEDDNHSAAVYDWASGTKLCDAKVNPDKVYDAKWNPKNNNEFAVCGVKLMTVFTQNGSTLKGAKCQLSKLQPQEQVISVNYVLGNILVTGTSKGNLVQWSGASLGKCVKGAHNGPIWNVVRGWDDKTFFSAGHDGKIVQWETGFNLLKTWDIKSTVNPSVSVGIRSLDWHPNKQKLVVGTIQSEVVEVDLNNKLLNVVVQGHHRGVKDLPEVWGCATHPTLQIFASAGADKCVRIWDDKKMLGSKSGFEHDVTALSWAQNGKFLAVGDRDGTVFVMDVQNLENLQIVGSIAAPVTGKNKDNWIEDLKFSPQSDKIAVGTHGGRSKVSIIQLDNRGKPVTAKPTKIVLSSALTSVDWSLDGETLQANSQAAELRWGNLQGEVKASAAKHMEFATCNSRFAWDTQGIWPGVDYTDVNSVDRSKNGTVLATGDDFGQVNLFRYPCVVEKAESREYFGHSSHVTKVRFSADDKFLVSTGGNDLTVMVWSTDINQGADEAEPQVQADYGEDPDDPAFETKVNRYKQQKEDAAIEKQKQFQMEKTKKSQDMGDFEEEDLGEGDQFLAVRPWKGQMKPPTGFKRAQKGAGEAPGIKLELDWVHGYKGDQAKNNLKYMADGTLAYYIAGVGVVYDPETHKQRFFQEHTDDVTCMDFHPDLVHCLTGENGRKPVAYIWDSVTCQPKHRLVGNGITHTITACAFSVSGKFALLVAGNDDHCMAVYDTQSGACVAKGKGVRNNVIEAKWKDDSTFCLVGSKLFCEVTICNGSFNKVNGKFGNNDQRIGSLAFNGTQALTGNIKNEIYVWEGTNIVKVVKLDLGRLVDAITVTQDYVFFGDRDKKIHVCDKQYKILWVANLHEFERSKKCNDAQVRAIACDSRHSKLFVGTYGHEIIELPINMPNRRVIWDNARTVINGHYAPRTDWTNELWGLTIFNQSDKYVTCSDDGKVKIWDAVKHELIKSISLTLDKKGENIEMDPHYKNLSKEMQGRAVDIHPKGALIAVGMNDGTLRVFESYHNDWRLVYTGRQGKEWIEDLKFSPDGQFLAVSGHDNKIQMFEVPGLKKIGKPFGASSSFITHLDWSLDSRYIRTNDGSYEILYYSVEKGEQIKNGASQFKDEPWATNSCTLGWAVQGIWQSGQDGSDINHCDRSHRPIIDNQQLLVTGDDFRGVNVYKYPSCVEPSASVKGLAHSSHVTKVRFSSSDKFIFSAGGNDTAVMQWRVVVPN